MTLIEELRDKVFEKNANQISILRSLLESRMCDAAESGSYEVQVEIDGVTSFANSVKHYVTMSLIKEGFEATCIPAGKDGHFIVIIKWYPTKEDVQ